MKNLITTLTLVLLFPFYSEEGRCDLFNFGVDEVDQVYEASPFYALVQDPVCPDGNCPLPNSFQFYTAPPVSNQTSWTWPGDLATHLQNDHGQNTAGMSHSEMENLHNSLHNGNVQSYQYSYSYSSGNYNNQVEPARAYNNWVRSQRSQIRLLRPRTWFPVMRARRAARWGF